MRDRPPELTGDTSGNQLAALPVQYPCAARADLLTWDGERAPRHASAEPIRAMAGEPHRWPNCANALTGHRF